MKTDQDLIQAYLDDALEEPEVLQLRELLRSDDTFLDAFLRAADLHGFLAGLRTERMPREAASRRVLPRRPAAPRVSWVPALAAAGFLAILLFVADLKQQQPRPLVKASVSAPRVTVGLEPEKPELTVPQAAPRQRLEELRVEETRLRTAPRAPEEKPEDRERKLVANDEERRAIEAELAKPLSAPAPRETMIKTATMASSVLPPTLIERATGNVYLARNAGGKRRAKKDDQVPLGWNVETPGSSSSALLRFSDGTWVEVLPNSVFREIAAPTATKGRQLFLASGSLESAISKQPADQPLVISTPTGEATILGTRLSLSHDLKLGTMLEVKEGKVLLTRLLDRKSVEVVTGQFAVAASGVEIVPQKSFPDEILIKFGPNDVPLKPGWVLDSGEEFDAKRGFGWIGPKNGPPVPGIQWRNPATGQVEQKLAGRTPVRRAVPADTDPLKATDIAAGWAGQMETWFMPMPNGRYLVSVCCGDLSYEQGPHHVWVEGVQIIDQKKNRVGESVEVRDVLVEVKDGELTMKVGGNPGKRVASDGSTETVINYLLIKRVRK